MLRLAWALAAVFLVRFYGFGTAFLPPSSWLLMAAVVAGVAHRTGLDRAAILRGARAFPAWVGSRGFIVGLLLVSVSGLVVLWTGLGADIGHAPLDIDENRLAATVRHFFDTGEVPHDTVEDYPGVYYWVLAGVYLCTFLVALMTEQVASFGELSQGSLVLAGRLAGSLLFAGAVWLTGSLGRSLQRDGGPRAAAVGVLAAGLGAFSDAGIRITGQFRSEPAFVLLLTGAACLALRVLRRGELRDALLAGAVAGLACGIKYTGVFALFPVILAVLMHQGRAARGRLLAAAVATFVLAVGLSNPFLWADFPNLIRQLEVEVAFTGAGHWSATDNPSRFYFHRLAFSYGLPLLIAAAGAIAWGIVRGHRAALVLTAAVVPYQMFMATRPAQFERWVYPLLPMVACLGAWGLVNACSWLDGRLRATRSPLSPGGARALAAGLFVLAVAAPAWRAVVVASQRAAPTTFERTEAWLLENAGAEDRVLVENGWLALEDVPFEVHRIPSLPDVLSADPLLLAAYDWIVVPEPYHGQPNRSLGEPVLLVAYQAGLGGSRGFDFELYPGPRLEPQRRPLQIDLEGPRSDRYLGPEWPARDPESGRNVLAAGRIYLPLRTGTAYTLTVRWLRANMLDEAGAASHVGPAASLLLNGRPLGEALVGCEERSPDAELSEQTCSFRLEPAWIDERTSILELERLLAGDLWLQTLEVTPSR